MQVIAQDEGTCKKDTGRPHRDFIQRRLSTFLAAKQLACATN